MKGGDNVKRLLYVAETEENGKRLYIGCSFACDGAEEFAKSIAHAVPLTISAFLIDTENGESAEEAARRCFGNGRHSFTFPEAIAVYSA